MGYLKTSISEDDLKERCKKAIKDHWSIHRLFTELKKEGKSCGYPRLRNMWLKCKGYIRDDYTIYRR